MKSKPNRARQLAWGILTWTLALLLLGSIVHATESSLACPDWPTCFGEWMPEMEGGVFWEHLHRMWAGALLVFFPLLMWRIARDAPGRRDLRRLSWLGMGLLLFQSAIGGVTVLYRLPDAISTTHLALALVFVSIVTVILTRLGTPRANAGGARIRAAGGRIGIAVFAQSALGALVRHADAGMACPDIPLCLGRIIPPLEHGLVQIHFAHRVAAVAVAALVFYEVIAALRRPTTRAVRALSLAIGVGVVLQIALGILSVVYRLAPLYASLHTLVAAAILVCAVAVAAGETREEARMREVGAS